MTPRELNAEVERVIFGHEVRASMDGVDYSTTEHAQWNDSYIKVAGPGGLVVFGGHRRVRDFSTSIADAWRVIEKLAPFYNFGLNAQIAEGYGVGAFVASFDERVASGWRSGPMQGADTAPRVICLAALAALRGKDPR